MPENKGFNVEIEFTAPLKDHKKFLGKGESVDDYGNQIGGCGHLITVDYMERGRGLKTLKF